jgi:hypothetical protein
LPHKDFHGLYTGAPRALPAKRTHSSSTAHLEETMSTLRSTALAAFLAACASAAIPLTAHADSDLCDETITFESDGEARAAELLARVIEIEGIFGVGRYPFLVAARPAMYRLHDGQSIVIDCDDSPQR